PARASSAWRVGLVGTTAACLKAGCEATSRGGARQPAFMLVAVVGTTAACLKAGCEATSRTGVARRQVASQPGGASCRARVRLGHPRRGALVSLERLQPA